MKLLESPLESGEAPYQKLILSHPQDKRSFVPGEPLIVADMFKTTNGISRAARTRYYALKSEDLTRVVVDLAGLFNQVEQDLLLTVRNMSRSRTGTLLLFAIAHEIGRVLMGLSQRRWRNWRINIGWVSELPVAPANWTDSSQYISENWVPIPFVKKSIGDTGGRGVKVVPHYVPMPGQGKFALPHEQAGDPFCFLCLADGSSPFHRKNVAASLRMFRNAFDSVDGSECFGLVMEEAAALGRPVVATGWSGNLLYRTERNSRLLPYSMERVQDSTGDYKSTVDAEWPQWAKRPAFWPCKPCATVRNTAIRFANWPGTKFPSGSIGASMPARSRRTKRPLSGLEKHQQNTLQPVGVSPKPLIRAQPARR